MNYLEEMFDFVDGSLEGEKELELFSALSADAELRTKMKNLYTIKNTAKENAAGYRPTAAETMAVFSALSIAPPSDMVPGQPTVFDKFGAVLNKYSQGIIGAFIAAALIFGYFAITGDEDSTAVSSTPFMSSTDGGAGIYSASDNGMALPPNSKINQDIPRVVSTDNSKKVAYSGSMNQRIGITDLSDNNRIVTDNESTADLEPSIQEFTWALGNNRLNFSGNIKYRQASEGMQANTVDLSAVPLNTAVSFIDGIKLEARGISNIDNISPYNTNDGFDLNNISFAVLYELGSGFSIGADIRQENFYYRKAEQLQSGLTSSYDRISNNLSCDVLLRYESDIMESAGLFPIAQLCAGISTWGYNGRIMIGAKYQITRKISIVGGFESSGLFHNDYPSLISRNSFTYGLQYGL